MSARGSADRGAWIDRVDWVLAVRGGSTGFTILVISGLVNLAVARMNELAGVIQLVAGLLLGFVVAAWRARLADTPVLTGAVAALFSYTLVVPLIYLMQRTLDIPVTLAIAGGALAVGAVTGFVLTMPER